LLGQQKHLLCFYILLLSDGGDNVTDVVVMRQPAGCCIFLEKSAASELNLYAAIF
jgi:hypothetical protein